MEQESLIKYFSEISRILKGLSLNEDQITSLWTLMHYYYKNYNPEQVGNVLEDEWKRNLPNLSFELTLTAQFQELCEFINDIKDEESERSRVEMISLIETRDQLSKCQQICNCCCKFVQYMYNIYIYIYIYIASRMGDSTSVFSVYNSRFDI